ncbi:hypothetical protein [Singulisphaera acidiphila]|uniref:Esterase n=1 Tax=Singulisphaera acidiphila (strain ATCC BAA-1392 / DSM 18658 / VKM B-2454 / MOB10) TaxID=886293 RepID=L0DHI9_SINAD|nr:hypothetical protein [Singulisphaera acidiphila]AGA28829.1 hypothetical protein Sinac_4652 [Singulisphaera acidiphila DSM 18658]
MGKLVLIEDKSNQGGGTVLFSNKESGWIRPTGVFVPDAGFTDSHEVVTVLLWFHGHFVKNVPYLFYKEATKILQAVTESKKDVILVAPELGWFQDKSNTTYNASALGGGKKTELYLDQVLGALSDWYVRTFIAGEIDEMGGPPPKFQIANLYIAGHSGGGNGIISSVAALGGYKDRLRQCWGFDCLYGDGQSWYEWAKAQKGVPLYFYFGQGTKPAFNGDVLGFWKRVYGTPKSPIPASGRMRSVFLAPALPGTELDMVAFQSAEDILAKARPGNRYEEVRRKVDPLLDNPTKYWSTIIDEGLKDHYPVVADLLGPRIKQSLP